MTRTKQGWIISVIFLLGGCWGGAASPVTVKHYTLEYAQPDPGVRIVSDAVVRIERFVSIQDYLGHDMLFRPKPFVRDAYRYHRWHVAPADMVQGLLLRDMRRLGLFRTVLSYEDAGAARYIIHGHVEEFLEVNEKDRSSASLTISITLLDTADGRETVRLQKTYRILEPFQPPRHPAAFAQGMSAAMARLSGEVIRDIRATIEDRKIK